MNVIRDFSLRYKLLFIFVLLALSMVAGLFTLRQLIILQFSEDVLPTQNVVSEFGYLVKEIQSETLEYVSLGQAETTQEFAQTAAQLNDVADQLPTLANDSGEADALNAAKAAALAILTTSESVLTSHSETLTLLEALEEAETEKENLIGTIDRGRLLDNPDIRPAILSLNQIVVLAEQLHTETLEYTLTGSSSTLAELTETRATLQAELETAQTALANNNLAQSFNAQFVSGTLTEIMGLSEQIVDNHSQTLFLLDELEDLESDAEQARFDLQALVQEDSKLLVEQTDTSLWAVGIFGQSVFIVLGILIARALVQPLLRLNSATQKLGQGKYDTRLAVNSKDEIGSLMLAFNDMAGKMEQAVADLRQQTQSIETSSKVSHRLSTILNVEELTTAVVELLKVQFNYYHAHIYLFDEAREYLKMVGGTGIAGQTLLESDHKIKAGQGLVGRTAQTNTPTLVPDVTQDPSWLPNPLLPDTQAEAAVPITLEGEVLGVLDIQNRQIGSLGPDDVELLQSVAWQVAIGLQNARLFEQVQKEKAQVQATLDAISLPIFISKVTDGTFFYFNDPALDLIGLSRQQLTGRPSFNFYDNVEDRTQFLTKLREERRVDNYELALRRNNGERFWASLNARIITFNGETAVMSTIIDITEQRQAQANLIRRAVEMETVAEVGTATATILDPTQLLNEVVNLIKAQFDLYHAHIHMLNDSGDTLVLTAGAGDIGRQMVEEGRRIPLKADGSLVASVARKIQGSIRNYEGAGEGFMPHPLLEKTRSEMAVPMAIGGKLLGVLDVRSETLAYFTEADIQTYTILATQIAVALQNARSYARSEEALKDLQALSRRLTREGWDEYLSDQPELAYDYDLREVRPYLNGNGHRNGKTGLLHPENPPFTQPLQIQGETIGQLTLPGLQTQDAETVEIVTAVAQRLSAHLENLRLTESSEVARANAERRNAELGLINRMMSSVTASLNLSGNMQIIAQELAEAINVSHVGIALLTEDKQNLEVVSEFPEPTDDVIGTLIPIKGNPLTEQAIQTSKFAIAYDAQNNPLTEPIHELMRQRNVHMLGVVPMIVGNEFFGTVGFDQTDSQRIMSEQEMRLAETIVYQAATVVQNARLFKQTQEALAETNEQARRLAVLNELSETLSRQTNLQGVVEGVMTKVPEILDATRLSLHLIDSTDKNMLRVVGVAGQVADVPLDELIPLEDSPMAEALTTRQLVQGYFDTGEEQMQAFFAPLFASGQPIGTFNMAMPQDKLIKESDRQILMQIASILGTTIENQRLFDQTQARAERERLLNNIVTRVAASLDLQHSLQIIVDEMATALNVDQVRVALLKPEDNALQIIAEHYDPSAPSALGMIVPLAGNELSLEVIRTRKMVVVEDAQNNPRTAPVHAMFREQGINTVVLLPLVVNDEVLGTIGLDILDERSFDLDTLQLAETIVYQAAVAIQNARLFEKSQEALAETEMLYAHSSQLNTATNFELVLETAAAPGFQTGAQDAMLLVYEDRSSSQPQSAQILARVPTPTLLQAKTMRLSEMPWAHLRPEIGKSIVMVGNVDEDGRLSSKNKAAFKEENIRALVIMYLNVGNLPIGQIIIRWNKCQTFTQVDERLFGAIAQQASSVVYNRVLFNQTEEALSETAALYQASADLNSAQSYDAVLTALRQHTVLGQGSHSVTINFFDRPWEENQQPEEISLLAHWSSFEISQPTQFRIDSIPGLIDLVSSEEILIHSDVATDERINEEFRNLLINAMNVNSAIYVPLIIGSRRVGFINGYFAKPRTFSDEQLRRLNVLVNQAAVSVQSIRLLNQTRRRADREALINSINQKILAAPTVEFALQTAVTELSQALKLKTAAIELISEQPQPGNGRSHNQNNGS